jgi:hypothetical protein
VKHYEGRRRLCRYLPCFTVFGPVFKYERKASLVDLHGLYDTETQDSKHEAQTASAKIAEAV